MGQIARGLQIKLSFDLLAVILDCLHAQMEFCGDFLGPLPFADELEHFQFAIAQPFDWGLLHVGLTADLLLEHFGGERVTHINISRKHTANGRRDFLQRFFLHQVTERAGPESQVRVNGLVMGADRQDGQARILRLDVAHQFETAAVLERKIGDDEIRLELLDGS